MSAGTVGANVTGALVGVVAAARARVGLVDLEAQEVQEIDVELALVEDEPKDMVARAEMDFRHDRIGVVS